MHHIFFPISASQDKCKDYVVWGIWTHMWYKLVKCALPCQSLRFSWSPGCWQLLSKLHYHFKYFNNCLIIVADLLYQVFYRTLMATNNLLDLNLHTVNIAEFLLISPLISLSPWGILSVCHQVQDGTAEGKWLLHWLLICHWKWGRARGHSSGSEVKQISLVAGMKQDTLGNCFTSQQCLAGSMTRPYIEQQLQSWGLNAASQTCLMSSYI